MDVKGGVPKFFLELLEGQYLGDDVDRIVEGMCRNRKVTIRVNTLKGDVSMVKEVLLNNGISFKEVPWSENALIIENACEADLMKLEIYEKGEIYLQSLSSMLPPIVLEPQSGEDILDMCAAPRR